MNDLLRIGDLSAVELEHAVELAEQVRDDPLGTHDALAGRSVACFLETRRRASTSRWPPPRSGSACCR